MIELGEKQLRAPSCGRLGDLGQQLAAQRGTIDARSVGAALLRPGVYASILSLEPVVATSL